MSRRTNAFIGRRWGLLLALPLLVVAGCGTKSNNNPDAAGDLSVQDTPGGDTAADGAPPDGLSSDVPRTTCGTFGQSCASSAGCCSGICGPSSTCEANPTSCSAAGFSCTAGSECCTGSCLDGFCSERQCTADGADCTDAAACCSGTCTDGTCEALNPSCSTTGNPCTDGATCCSQYCSGGFCATPSFCIQVGDACAQSGECCSGTCTIAAGATVGTCGAIPTGSTYCSDGVDGVLCGDCNACCSRLCAPYGPTGVKVCQPAQGCRVNGDLCRTDQDCCGGKGSGLPGDGNVTCQKESPDQEIGICRNPMSCNPEGNVCHFQDYACSNSSARNNCCAAVGNSGVCKLDALGVPRCYGLGDMCRQAGETCAFAGDCCNEVPCIPDATGTLRCAAPAPDGGVACSDAGGSCTVTGDCCVGSTCVTPVGSIQGSCTPVGTPDGGPPPPPPDMMSGDAGPPPPPPACGQFGQACNGGQPCCESLTCYVNGSNPLAVCPAGQTTGCTCNLPRPQG